LGGGGAGVDGGGLAEGGDRVGEAVLLDVLDTLGDEAVGVLGVGLVGGKEGGEEEGGEEEGFGEGGHGRWFRVIAKNGWQCWACVV
jgi:hypothetical protein